jgi:hypothetical protein
MIVHLCSYASQPAIQIFCDQSWTTPAWDSPDDLNLPENVYASDDNRYYTFNRDCVTCKSCLNKMF